MFGIPSFHGYAFHEYYYHLFANDANHNGYRVSIRAVEVARGEKVGKEDLEDIQDPGAPREGQAHATLPQRVHSGFCAHAQNTL